MKKFIAQVAFGLCLNGIVMSALAGGVVSTPALKNGFYAGVGGSWNTIDESFSSSLFTSTGRSGTDNYDANQSRLAPLVQIGYWAPFNCDYLWGTSLQWKYLGYKTPNENAGQGQYLPNSTFSSINFFGPNVLRDFSSQTQLNNEVLLLFYAGKQFQHGYAYIGAGPALFTATNKIFVSSIHIPNGVGSNLVSTSVTNHKTIWGGAIQAGYNYHFDRHCFAGLSFTYAQTGKNNFNNSINAATLNGFNVPTGAAFNLHRSISFRVQEIMFSINKVF